MDLSADEFERLRVEEVEREVTRPDGQVVPWMDNVIVLRRRTAALAFHSRYRSGMHRAHGR